MSQSKEKLLQDMLQEEAACTSAKLAKRIGMSHEELKGAYQRLKGQLPPLSPKTFGVADFFRRIMERDVLADVQRILSFREQQFVFPDSLELHLGPACQCACRFCWRWDNGQWTRGDLGLYRKELRTAQHLKASEFRSLSGLLKIEEVQALFRDFKRGGGQRLYFSGGLEFFTSPIAEDAIRCAVDTGITSLFVYTNGVANCFDKPEFLELLVESAESIRFSLHAATPETYAFVQMPHRPQDEAEMEFRNVRHRIERILQMRNQMQSANRKAKIGVAFLVVGRNLHELRDAIQWMTRIGIDDCDIRVDMCEKEAWFSEEEITDLKRILGTIQEDREKGVFSPMVVNARFDANEHIRQKLKQQHVTHCRIPLKKPAVDPWGYVYECCYRNHPSMQDDGFLLGKFPEKSLSEILRGVHSSPRYPRIHCRDCTDWEMAYNACVEKVLSDWDQGISPDELPYEAKP